MLIFFASKIQQEQLTMNLTENVYMYLIGILAFCYFNTQQLDPQFLTQRIKIKRSDNNISVFYNWNLKTQMTAAFVTCLFQLNSWANHTQKQRNSCLSKIYNLFAQTDFIFGQLLIYQIISPCIASSQYATYLNC